MQRKSCNFINRSRIWVPLSFLMYSAFSYVLTQSIKFYRPLDIHAK